jgi:apolipoprotein N-acyltransferase
LEIEYTDAPSSENETASLARSAEGKLESAEGKASDLVAAMLQVIPGLGYVYKGYRLLGLLALTGGAFALLAGGLAATATAGFGLALIPIYWFGIMFHVYAIPDRVASTVTDEGEEY